jgi:ribosomal protein S21
VRPTREIRVEDGNIEKAIFDLRKWWSFDGIGAELKLREHFLSRKEKEKIKRRAVVRRLKKQEKKLAKREERRRR